MQRSEGGTRDEGQRWCRGVRTDKRGGTREEGQERRDKRGGTKVELVKKSKVGQGRKDRG